MSIKRRLDRLEAHFNDFTLMRRGDRAAAQRLLDRETDAFLDDLYGSPDAYQLEVERIISGALDDVASAYRAAFGLIVELRTADAARVKAVSAQIETAFDELPALDGRSLLGLLDDFYSTNRPGFKIGGDDLTRIADLLSVKGVSDD